MDLQWIEIPGEYSRSTPIPTLLWTRTPVTLSQLDRQESGAAERYPVTEINHAEAVEIAAGLGGRLPRSAEWEWMASGPQLRCSPWGNRAWRPEYANLLDSGHNAVTPVDSHLCGSTPDGLLDVAGNVWEWTMDAVPCSGFIIRGGSYATPATQWGFVNAASAESRSRGIGLRVVREC